MNIFAKIEGIEYKIIQPNDLSEISFDDFNINNVPSSCLVKDKKYSFAVSKWVSPKRTRSYPFERVYNTLSIPKKLTVIPVIKDEGARGDRDYIQWDTVSLMSLLDVYVIFAYYDKAEKHKTREDKIINQQFNNQYVTNKIKEISTYHSSALHWNLREIKESLLDLIKKIKIHYNQIERHLKVRFHSQSGIDKFQKQFEAGVRSFMETSRYKAKAAQHREELTDQPKEILATATKAAITIMNYLGGLYYFTVDEIAVEHSNLYLIEGKHSENSKLPATGDIKDGLLKMILYCNLKDVSVENKKFKAIPVLKLTSSKLSGCIKSESADKEKESFFYNNNLNLKQISLIDNLITESRKNNFVITVQGI